MRRALLVTVMVAGLLTVSLARVEAGTVLFGVKYWYAYWDSAVLDWFEKDVNAGFKSNGVDLDSDIELGSGYLAGPLLGYQTQDGTWSFSLAPMLFSSFSQDWEGETGMMDLETDVDTDRKDIDFAITYSLARHQDVWSGFKYTRVFLGYKFQLVHYDLTLGFDTLMGEREFDYELDAQVHMPTLGVGFVYPVFEQLALGLQLGAGVAFIELELEDPDGDDTDISPDASLAYNGEFTITYAPIKQLLFQLGFRAQLWYLKARSPQWWEETESEDWTYGPTVSVVYAF